MSKNKKRISQPRLKEISESLYALATITQEEAAMLTGEEIDSIRESFPQRDHMTAMNLISNSSFRRRYKDERPSDGGVVNGSPERLPVAGEGSPENPPVAGEGNQEETEQED